MIIERKNKLNSVFFGSLNLGDCFEYNDSVCMKTATWKEYEPDGINGYNAVYVGNGQFASVVDNEAIIPLNVKLVEI